MKKLNKKILILGGTNFIGRVFLEEIEKNFTNYNITLFNRGKTNDDLFTEYSRIKGDRYTEDILKVCHDHWDIIIDFSCYSPKSLHIFLPQIKNKVGRYIFISTVAVYDFEYAYKHGGDVTEDFPLLSYTEDMDGDDLYAFYGHKKAECERVLQSYTEIDSIILRPSIVYGRLNVYERIYYWMHRIQHHDLILLPDGGKVKRSYTFINDLVQMIFKSMLVENHQQTYNAISYPPETLINLLNHIKNVYQSSSKFIDVPIPYLLNKNDEPLRIPMWHYQKNFKYSNDKIVKEFNLDFHSIRESFRLTKEYYSGISKNKEGNIGLKLNHEKTILFGYLLDHDLFEDLAFIIEENCTYKIGGKLIQGAKDISDSYKNNMIEGRKKLDKLEWGKSKVKMISENEYIICFTDYLTHQNKKHTFQCQQKLIFNEFHKIKHIEHIHDSKEELGLKEYYQRVGL